MSRRILVAAALAAILAGGSATALAQPEHGGRRPHGGPRGGPMGGPAADLGLRGLDLTDAQRDQVRAIMESHRAASEQTRTRLRDAHRAMREATATQPIDEAAVRAKSADIGAAMADAAILRAKVRAEVFALLTPEQQQKAADRGHAGRERRERQRR